MSILISTARAEIARKDKRIADLERKLEDMPNKESRSSKEKSPRVGSSGKVSRYNYLGTDL